MWNTGQRKPEFWHILRSNTNFWKNIELTRNSQLHVPYPGVSIVSLTLNIFSRLILRFRIHLKPIFALCIFSMCTLLCILHRLNSFILKLTIEVIGRHCRCWIYCWFWKKTKQKLARYLEYLLWMCIFRLAKCLFDPFLINLENLINMVIVIVNFAKVFWVPSFVSINMMLSVAWFSFC